MAACSKFLCAFFLSLAVACAGQAPHPEEVLAHYLDHVRNHRPDAIYDMLDEPLRAGMDREAFRAFFAANHEEILAQAEEIVAVAQRERMQILAALPVEGRGEVHLRYTEGRWLLLEDLPALAHAVSPLESLHALQAAVDKKDLAAVIALLSREKAEMLRAELHVLTDSISSLTDRDIVINADIATIYLEWGIRLEMRFEDGTWRFHRILQ